MRYALADSRRTPVAPSMRLSGHSSRPSAITCCFFSSLKTFTSPGGAQPQALVKETSRRRYDWPVFRCPSLAGFGCPPRMLAVVVAAALGQLVFAQPMMRATASFEPTIAAILLVGWLMAPLITYVVGRWSAPPPPVRIWLRAVMGSIGSPHRPAAAVGPADTSRAAEPRSLDAIAAVLRDAKVAARRGRRVLRSAAERKMRVRLKASDAARNTPESLVLEASSMLAALPTIAALVAVFGALELRTLSNHGRVFSSASDADSLRAELVAQTEQDERYSLS